MKKSVKRVLCAALACSFSCALAAGRLHRFDANGAEQATTALSATFENVTERFDTLTLREQNFNSQVLKTKNTLTDLDSQDEQNVFDLEENELVEQSWAAQPYSTYHNEKYILPMGRYVYLLDENEEKMYAKEEYCAVSRYNEYYSDDGKGSYMTSTGIKSLSFLRNASVVKYKLYDAQTGEFILDDVIHFGEKEDADGGAIAPANLELDFLPEEYGLVSNGQYRMDFEFFTDTPAEDESAAKENAYSFSFTVDYEAPILENVRVRYYDYKDGAKEKQKIYLDVDVYDNHYAQAIMLCYPKTNAGTSEEERELRLATEYPTPVRSAVKNGTTTVSIEITDIYEEYGEELYLLIDDYALNSCLYQVDIAEANAAQTFGTNLELAEGEEALTLGIYETHKVALKNIGNAHLSNYVWKSGNEAVAKVKNGEIVGLQAGETTVSVSDPKAPSKVCEIHVTVTEEQAISLLPAPALSFGAIQTSTGALQKATGVVLVNAGQEIAISYQTDPWYYPMTDLSLKWSSTDESVAKVEDGLVNTLKKGTTMIVATVLLGGVETRYCASVTLRVGEEFDVSNFTLKAYYGVGYNEGSKEKNTEMLVLPNDIKHIGENAFKNNANVRRIVIPASVVEIHERAFENCKTLEEVYFESKKHSQTAGQTEDTSIDFSDLSIVHRRAFYNCKALKKIDFSNVKTITLDPEAFKNCVSLQEKLTLRAAKIGDGAFSGCVNLQGVKFELSNVEIGAGAFENCGANLQESNFEIDFNENTVKSIGNGAFKGAKLAVENETFALPDGLLAIGENVFENCQTVKTVALGNTDLDVAKLLGRAFKGLNVTVTADSTKLAEEQGVIYALENGVKNKIVYVNDNASSGEKGKLDLLASGITEIGEYAFAGVAGITELVLPETLTAIGDGAFANASIEKIQFNGAAITEIPARAFTGSKINSIELPASVSIIGDYAFSGAKKLANANLENVLTIGDYAFYDTAFATLNLASVKSVGAFAFAASKKATYNTVSLPAVETIGMFAFLGGLETTVTLPQSVKEIGIGAFASSKNLVAITFATETDEIVTTNGTFFVENNVLYRYLDEQKTRFAVLCYPAALAGTTSEIPVQTLDETQKRFYKIKEGTVRVEAYAFYALQKGALDHVILPYSVKVIGHAAFFASGVKEYTFESIQAPVLEAAYRASVAEAIETLAKTSTIPLYKGYYYSNFQTSIYNYTHYVGWKKNLTSHYPTNGKGYDTYMYRLYFGTRNKTDVMMTDDTRACLELVNALPTADEVTTWLDWDATDIKNKASVEHFAAQVKAARASYNNVLKDEAQTALFGEENAAKLLAIEEQLRAVKAHFNIPVYVTGIATAKTSEHKATYTEGEKFDWTGLVLTVTYDDGSTTELTPESGSLTLKDEGHKLALYDSYVIVEYTANGTKKSARVVITVNARELSSIEKYPEEANVMRNVLIYGGSAMMLVGGIGVLVMLVIHKRKLANKNNK